MSFYLAATLLLTGFDTPAMTEHQQEVASWRAQRIERLTAPAGWLSLVGLHWLPGEGVLTLGQGPDLDVDLGRGPAALGRIEWRAGQAFFHLQDGAQARVGESELGAEPLLLNPEADTPAPVVSFGSASFQLLVRGDKFALRVRDSEAPTRTRFAGIPHFDVDPSWRIEARFEPHPEPRTIEVATVAGTLESYPNPGRIVFERDGRSHSLEALEEQGSSAWFFIFADRTSGRESYGMARYLYAGPPVDGKLVIDFNKAYNPPCAFTDYATCPMPPEGNRLDLAVRAGEKKYIAPAGD